MVKPIYIDEFLGISKKKKRKPISQTLKNEVMVRQEYKCYNCPIILPAKKHFHHKNLDSSDNKVENIIALCPNCHYELHHKIELKKQELEKQNKKPKDIMDMDLDDFLKLGKY